MQGTTISAHFERSGTSTAPTWRQEWRSLSDLAPQDRRDLLVPIGRLLVSVGELQRHRFPIRPGGDLQPDRHSLLREPARQRQRRYAEVIEHRSVARRTPMALIDRFRNQRDR